jgi:flagellar motor switch protein FliN/FliY
MTDEPSSPTDSGAASSLELAPREYVEAWAKSMGQVLDQITGSPLPVESLTAPRANAPAPDESDLQIVVVVAGALRGEMSLRIPRASALVLAHVFLGEPQAAEFKSEHREALEELLRQVAGYVATALKPRWGEVQLHVESAPPPSWSPGASGWLVSAQTSENQFAIEWQLSAALHAALLASGTPLENQASEPQAESRSIASGENNGIVEGNLDLLMDVELEVVLRFGERNMLLREILELGTGAVVELDRQIEEPVDLLLDGKVIARGEVVVVDGNYGLRVLEVLSPQLAG